LYFKGIINQNNENNNKNKNNLLNNKFGEFIDLILEKFNFI
jgi:hypothetical protein